MFWFIIIYFIPLIDSLYTSMFKNKQLQPANKRRLKNGFPHDYQPTTGKTSGYIPMDKHINTSPTNACT